DSFAAGPRKHRDSGEKRNAGFREESRDTAVGGAGAARNFGEGFKSRHGIGDCAAAEGNESFASAGRRTDASGRAQSWHLAARYEACAVCGSHGSGAYDGASSLADTA